MSKRKQIEHVRDRMSKLPLTVTSGDSLQSALDLLYKHNVRELPVMDHGRLVGIVTDRDLRQISPSYPVFRDQEEIRVYLQNLKVASAMTVDPLVISPEASL
ncbi:MAG TPA: CBS domain-containing protein, partial [Candidatus Binatia bacterium]